MSELERPPAPTPETTSEERTWAALAHLSTILTMLLSFCSLGLAGLLFVFVPFLIYVAYKDRSSYVAFHAAQAFAIQVVGTIGYFLVFLLGLGVTVLVWVISAVLVVILIGILLLAIAAPLVTAAYVLAVLATPFVLGVFSIIAAIEVSSGKDYRYPYLGRWVRNWLERTEPEAIPAV